MNDLLNNLDEIDGVNAIAYATGYADYLNLVISDSRHYKLDSKVQLLEDLPAMLFRVIWRQNRITLDMRQRTAAERMRQNAVAWTQLNTLQYDGLG